MAGYIGAKQGVTQVDGYNRSEADAEFVQTTGDTMTGPLNILAPGSSAVGSAGYFLHVAGSTSETDPERYMIGFSHGNNTNPTNVRAAVGLEVSLGGAGNLVFETGVGAGGQLERVRIDGAGRVTMPYQPAFYAYRATAGNTTYNPGEVIFPQVKYNVGGHYNTSNGRFTAPVAGIYMFTAAVYNAENTYSRWTFRVNSSSAIAGQGGIQTAGVQLTLAVAHFLNANDYVSLFSNYTGQVLFHDIDHTSITGYFLG